jgi:hypothetical protein
MIAITRILSEKFKRYGVAAVRRFGTVGLSARDTIERLLDETTI